MLAPSLCFFLFVAVLLGVLTWLFPLGGLSADAVFLLYIIWYLCHSWAESEVHPADVCAALMYQGSHGRTPNLPEKLQGVFWMSDNAAPELLCTLDGGELDQQRRRLVLTSGAPLNWSYSTGILGRWYWAILKFSYLLNSKLHFNFNEDYTFAEMPLYMFGCIWVPMGMTWDMRQIDENTWSRDIYYWCSPGKPSVEGSYILKRVMDSQGRKLPAFGEMMESVEQGWKIKNITQKSVLQIINGRPGGGGCCGLLPGRDKHRLADGSDSAALSSSW